MKTITKGRRLTRSFPSTVSSLALIRQFVRDEAEAAGLPEHRSHDLLIAVNEAATNSILHSGSLVIRVAWRAWSDGVEVEVIDDGVFRSSPNPERHSTHLGIQVMRSFVDGFEIVRGTQSRLGTIVRLTMDEPLDLLPLEEGEEPVYGPLPANVRAFPVRRRVVQWAAAGAAAAALVAAVYVARDSVGSPGTSPAAFATDGTDANGPASRTHPSSKPRASRRSTEPRRGSTRGTAGGTRTGSASTPASASHTTAPTTPSSGPTTQDASTSPETPASTRPTGSSEPTHSTTTPPAQPSPSTKPPTPTAPSPTVSSGPIPVGLVLPAVQCPSDPLLGLPSTATVHVDAACQWVVGSVQSVSGSAEQGYTVHVLPETDYVSLLTSANQTSLGGAIPVQVLPGQAFPVPRTGERIAAIGTLSLDTLHSWHTLTPVWAVDYLDRDGQVVTSIPAPVDAVAPGTTPETPSLGL